MKLVKRGSRGEDVIQLQKNLNLLGYNLDEDGIFGQGCYDAVVDFQKKQNLDADGIAGSGTWNAITAALSGEPEPVAGPPAEAQKPIEGDVLITKDELGRILDKASAENIDKYYNALNKGMIKYGINTRLRMAHFIAQLAHESANFKYSSENLNYSSKALRAVFGKYFPSDDLAEEYARKPEKIANRVYGGRMSNGDESSGDGWKYRGRGLIQLTGKDNYTKCGAAIGLNLVEQPDLLADDAEAAVMAAGWFWDSRKLNNYADNDDVLTVTKRINGGTHGLDDRKAHLARAKKILNI
jgi:putative chitinase